MLRRRMSKKLSLLVGILAGSIVIAPAFPQSTQANEKPAAQAGHSPYQPSRFSKRATEYYGLVWGVDSLAVKSTESGEVIRFSYRVLDAKKAKTLNDKK